MSKTLSERANLDWYRKAAKKKLRELRVDDPSATIAKCQLAISRANGFKSWRALRQHIESLTRLWDRAVAAVQGDQLDDLVRILRDRPTIVIQRTSSSSYSLLHYVPNRVGENKPLRLAILKLLLEAGLPVDTALPFNSDRTEGGETALHFAATLNDTEIVDALIAAGASVHLSASGDGGTPLVQGLFYGAVAATERLASEAVTPGNLRTAAGLGRLDLIDQFIIGGKLSPAAGQHRQFYRPHNEFPAWTPSANPQEWLDEALIYAARNGRVDAAARLIDLGANVNAIPYFASALHFAAHDGRREIVELLLDHGADATLIDRKYNGIAEDWARHSGQNDIAQLLANHSGKRANKARFDPALVKAFAEALERDRGDVEAIRKLLDEHPELVNCQPWMPKWPHSAVEAAAHLCVWHRPKMIEIVRLLLSRGATADLPTVARAGLLDEVKRRLDGDPSLVDRPDSQGRTAIYRAACKYGALHESAAVIQHLIVRGATVDVFSASALLMIDRLKDLLRADSSQAKARDPEGLTALHWVTRTDANDRRQVEAAKLLLDAGADPNAEASTQSGMRPLHCAAEWASSIELAGLLIDRGANIDAASSQSPWTPLDYAMDRNREAMRDYLRSRGGKTRQELAATEDTEANAFLALVHRGDIDAVREKLDADPSLANRAGKHPQWGGRPQALHVAIERGDSALFDLLLAHGANPNGDNALYDQWSPLMLAIHWKRDAMRDMLRKRVDHVSLIDALMMGDDKTALRIMKSGPIVLQRSMPNDATMLHFCRTVPAAKRLIELGVPIDARDKHGKTSLDLAATRGDGKLVDFLMHQGAAATVVTFVHLGNLARVKEITAKPHDPELLKAAIEAQQEKIIRWILNTGKDINEPDAQGISPLHTAAWQGNLEIVKMLVKAGANLFDKDAEHDAMSAQWARHNLQTHNKKSCEAVAEFLEKQMKKAAKTWSVNRLPEHRKSHKIAQWKPIMDAAFIGDAPQIKKLLAGGAGPNIVSTTPAKYRPLHRAIESKKTFPRTEKHIEAVKALLAGGADPMLRGTWGQCTALQLAATHSPQFIPILIDRFKPLDIFHACALADEKRVSELLKKEKSLAKSTDVNHWTPLHYVAASVLHRGHRAKSAALVAIAKMLLKAEADVMVGWNFNDEWPLRPLYYAAGYSNHPALVELFLKAGADPCDNESVYHASDEGHDACLALIEKHTDAKKLAVECTQCLRTQMHWNHSKGAPWLLAHGADPNSPSPEYGESALHAAVRNGASDEVLGLLLKYGADPAIKTRDGKSAMVLAKATKKQRIVRLLLDSNADPRRVGPVD
jgi:ankyrin repeat protein